MAFKHLTDAQLIVATAEARTAAHQAPLGEKTDEKQQAWQIANQWLDQRMNPLTQMVPGDPDCDACVLARQYMRALDTIHQLRPLIPMVEFNAAGQAIIDNAKLWPKSVQ